jgi:hypothetical protein
VVARSQRTAGAAWSGSRCSRAQGSWRDWASWRCSECTESSSWWRPLWPW